MRSVSESNKSRRRDAVGGQLWGAPFFSLSLSLALIPCLPEQYVLFSPCVLGRYRHQTLYTYYHFIRAFVIDPDNHLQPVN